MSQEEKLRASYFLLCILRENALLSLENRTACFSPKRYAQLFYRLDDDDAWDDMCANIFAEVFWDDPVDLRQRILQEGIDTLVADRDSLLRVISRYTKDIDRLQFALLRNIFKK